MEQVDVTIDQNYFLFCCAEKYNISCEQHSLSSKSNYFLRYTYPDGTKADGSAHLSSTNVLTSQSPEHDHSCTVHARLYTSGEQPQTITEFSLDLVSPVEYLFRKFSANEFDMSEKISNKMTSALLAMSLSYYFVMGEHVEKEMRRTDEILSTLLNWSTNDSYLNVTEGRKEETSAEAGISLFAQHYKLQKTLRQLSRESNVGDLPVHLPKSFLPPVEKIPPRRPAIIPRTRSSTLPTESKALPITKQVSKSSSEYSPLQPVELDPQEGYMYMEKPDQFEVNEDVPDNSDEEEYFLVDPPVSDSKGKQPVESKSLLTKQPIAHFSPPTALPRLPIDDFLPDDVYELCDLSPAELAAVELLKKRGPRPKPPISPYRGSHTRERSHSLDKAGEYGVLRPGELNDQFKSSLESSLKCSLERMSLKEGESKPPPLGPKPPVLGPKPSVKEKPPITSPKPVRELKAPPRKKHNILHKTNT